MEELINNIVQWHYDRNLIDGSTDRDQFLKLLSEIGELSESLSKKRDVTDDIGDIIVVLANIATRNKLTITDCLAKSWNEIKDRKGKMVDGIFIKEADL
jgi:NTP pyrophosphatase (non-canonical NTP hydrolase)